MVREPEGPSLWRGGKGRGFFGGNVVEWGGRFLLGHEFFLEVMGCLGLG